MAWLASCRRPTRQDGFAATLLVAERDPSDYGSLERGRAQAPSRSRFQKLGPSWFR
jgi:hypothetical protein